MRGFAFQLRVFAELLLVGVPLVAMVSGLHHPRAMSLLVWLIMAAWLVGGSVLLIVLRPLINGLGMEVICRNCKQPLDENRTQPTCPHCGHQATVRY